MGDGRRVLVGVRLPSTGQRRLGGGHAGRGGPLPPQASRPNANKPNNNKCKCSHLVTNAPPLPLTSLREDLEVAPCLRSPDTMLARLEAHVAEQQRFAANASHELRTPLAVTQTLLESPATIRTATTANSSTASTSSTPERSTSPKRCSCSAAPTNGPSPENTSTCPS